MKLKRILSFFGITAIIILGGIITLILFPQPLFSHSFEYKNFKVYSNYTLNQEAFVKTIDEAVEIVNKSEINNSNYNFDIFLANRTLYNKFDDLIFGQWSVARAIDNNVIIKREVNELEEVVSNDKNQFDLVYVLVHEMIHCLQSEKYGMWSFNPVNPPPLWKLEGYPEYIGRRELLESTNYNLKIGIKDFLIRTASNDNNSQIIQISENESTPFIYYKGRLMVEYLMDVKNMSYGEILTDSIKEENVYSEMIDWYNKK